MSAIPTDARLKHQLAAGAATCENVSNGRSQWDYTFDIYPVAVIDSKAIFRTNHCPYGITRRAGVVAPNPTVGSD